MRPLPLALAAAALSCSGSVVPRPPPPPIDPCATVGCASHASCVGGSCVCDPGYTGPVTACAPSTSPAVGGCALFPPDHVFNTRIDALPVHPGSAAFLARIGDRPIHLDLGRSEDMASAEYWGIPYNVVRGDALTWSQVRFFTSDTTMTWDPRPESDCAAPSASGHAVVSPCTEAAAPSPLLPVPASPLVEGGLVTDQGLYGDHHMLVVDADTCRLWELYHCYPRATGGWDIFGAASWDLTSSALRTDGWTSADAAGLPILPLLLRADEAASGEIRHALRFTVAATHASWLWPARHQAGRASPADLPPMGLLLRLRSGFAIPAGWSVQSKAIARAMQVYGMYLADNGSSIYVQGEPSAAWDEAIWSEVQTLRTADFEAVDLSPIAARPGFDPNSARVPPP